MSFLVFLFVFYIQFKLLGIKYKNKNYVIIQNKKESQIIKNEEENTKLSLFDS